MRARATLLLGAVALLCACDQAPSPSAAPTAEPTATADVRVSAAEAYIAALTAYHNDMEPVERTICASASVVGALRQCWSRKLAIQQAFDRAMVMITFPADLQKDVGILRYTDGRLEASMGGVATSPYPARDFADLGVYSAASVDFLQISTNLRQELGILATPTP